MADGGDETTGEPGEPGEPAIHVRPAQPDDLSAILTIEHQQFFNPWKRDYLEAELRHDIAHVHVAVDGVGGAVSGYIIFWIIADQAELHRIAVGSASKKQGVGRTLFAAMLATMKQKNANTVFLEVRSQNRDAVRFYGALGMSRVGQRKDYYRNPVDDALLYRLDL